MRILVTGAFGFIGSQIVTALRQHGHEVIGAVRGSSINRGQADLPLAACDFEHDTSQTDWLPRLENVDAVVNCAGILRQNRDQHFERIHHLTPAALFDACQEKGIRKVIQISALGDPRDSAFVSSKHAADAHLQALELDWVILRPSVVYTASGSYGGTSLLRALAALPFALLLPGGGHQQLQPVRGEDLARAVVHSVENDDGHQQILEVVGPEPVSIRHYLLSLRRWLGFDEPKLLIRSPLWLIYPFAMLGEWLGRGPLGMTMYRMLQRGNTGKPDAAKRFRQYFGFDPVSLETALAQSPSYVQDRWHARLYLLRPFLRVMLALLWIGSGIAGLMAPLEVSTAYVVQLGMPTSWTAPLVYTASVVDLVLGTLLLLRVGIYWVTSLMLFSLLAYTLILGAALPTLWLEPFGALLKNLPLIPALLILMALEQQR